MLHVPVRRLVHILKHIRSYTNYRRLLPEVPRSKDSHNEQSLSCSIHLPLCSLVDMRTLINESPLSMFNNNNYNNINSSKPPYSSTGLSLGSRLMTPLLQIISRSISPILPMYLAIPLRQQYLLLPKNASLGLNPCKMGTLQEPFRPGTVFRIPSLRGFHRARADYRNNYATPLLGTLDVHPARVPVPTL